MSLRSDLMDKYFETPEEERGEYTKLVMTGLAERMDQIKSSVAFEIEYALYYFVNDFKVIGESAKPYEEFLTYLNRTKDISEIITSVDDGTSWGLFCRALVATQGEEGFFPVYYKFLVEYGWYYDNKITDDWTKSLFNRTTAGLHAICKTCNFSSSLDLRRVMSIFANISASPSDRNAEVNNIYKNAMELTDDTSLDSITKGQVRFSLL